MLDILLQQDYIEFNSLHNTIHVGNLPEGEWACKKPQRFWRPTPLLRTEWFLRTARLTLFVRQGIGATIIQVQGGRGKEQPNFDGGAKRREKNY